MNPNLIESLIPAVDHAHWVADVRFALGVVVALGGAAVLLTSALRTFA